MGFPNRTTFRISYRTEIFIVFRIVLFTTKLIFIFRNNTIVQNIKRILLYIYCACVCIYNNRKMEKKGGENSAHGTKTDSHQNGTDGLQNTIWIVKPAVVNISREMLFGAAAGTKKLQGFFVVVLLFFSIHTRVEVRVFVSEQTQTLFF